MQTPSKNKLAGLLLTGLSFAAVLAMAPNHSQAYDEGIDSLSGNYLAGAYARRLRDTEKAAEYFTRALRDDPNNPILIERAFQLEVGRGNFDRAAKLATRVTANDNRNRIANVVLAMRAIKLEKYSEAREFLKQSAYTPIGQLTSGLLTAWTLAGEGRMDKAFRALKDLEKTESFGIYQTFHSALIADFLNRPMAARRHFERAYDEAGGSLRVVQTYGSYLERNDQRSDAIKVYENYFKGGARHPLVRRALANAQANSKPSRVIRSVREGVAEAMFSLSSVLADQTGIDLALLYVQLALEMRPGFPVALNLLGEIYEDTKRYENAIGAFERIPAGSVLRENAEIRIAVNYDNLDQADKAQNLLMAQIERDPNAFQPVLTLANLLRSHDKFSEAAEQYSKAITLIKTIQPRHWSLFHFRGISYERSKRWPEAEADFRKALELNNDQPLVLNYLGYSWIEQGRNLDDAMDMIRKAVELRPNDGYIVDSLGWAHFKLKNYDEAVKHLERAVELRPDDPVINDHLGDAYWRSGRKLEAKFQWQHAKDNKPEKDDLLIIEEKLTSGLPEDTPDAAADTAPEPEKKS